MNFLKNPVFDGIAKEEYEELQRCGFVRQTEYPKESVMFHMGDRTSELGILLSGEIYIEYIDLWGNRMIMHRVSEGEAFAETYAFCQVPMMMDVIAAEDCDVLLLNVKRLLRDGNSRKSWYTKILYNLLRLSAGKNLAWSNRMLCISSKHIRARIMTYLSAEAVKCKSQEIAIPFDRQQMADYLNVDRSALSKELGRMKKEGILTFHKNRFCLLQTR